MQNMLPNHLNMLTGAYVILYNQDDFLRHGIYVFTGIYSFFIMDTPTLEQTGDRNSRQIIIRDALYFVHLYIAMLI